MGYRKSIGINQSALKKILSSPKAYLTEINRVDDDSIKPDYFTNGTLVDFVLTEPDKKLEDYYYVQPDIKISDAIKKIVTDIFDYYENLKTQNQMVVANEEAAAIDEKIVLKFIDANNYGQSWKPETRIKKVFEEGGEYYKSLTEAKGRIVINEAIKAQANLCLMSIKADEKLRKYFVKEEHTEIIFKKLLYFSYKGFKCKGEMDEIFIDHKLKEITLLDIKTTGDSVLNFSYNFWKFRYDFQGAFYTFGAKQDPYIKGLLDNGYIILPFKFLIIELGMFNRPVIYNASNEVYNIGAKGGVLSSGRQLEGVTQAFNRLEWHTKEDLWEFPMEYYMNNEEFEIKV